MLQLEYCGGNGRVGNMVVVVRKVIVFVGICMVVRG
jgi:hypothetical protein